MLIFGVKAHLIDTHLLVSRSRSSAKVMVKYQGHVSEKMGVSGALVFHKHILFILKLGLLYFQAYISLYPLQYSLKAYGFFPTSLSKQSCQW